MSLFLVVGCLFLSVNPSWPPSEDHALRAVGQSFSAKTMKHSGKKGFSIINLSVHGYSPSHRGEPRLMSDTNGSRRLPSVRKIAGFTRDPRPKDLPFGLMIDPCRGVYSSPYRSLKGGGDIETAVRGLRRRLSGSISLGFPGKLDCRAGHFCTLMGVWCAPFPGTPVSIRTRQWDWLPVFRSTPVLPKRG